MSFSLLCSLNWHKWDEGRFINSEQFCLLERHCLRCGVTQTEKSSHLSEYEYESAGSCIARRLCKRCGFREDSSRVEHTRGTWVEQTDKFLAVKGCERCGAQAEASLEAYRALQVFTKEKMRAYSLIHGFDSLDVALSLFKKMEAAHVDFYAVSSSEVLGLYRSAIALTGEKCDFDVRVERNYRTEEHTNKCWGCAHGDTCMGGDCGSTYEVSVFDSQEIKVMRC